MKEVQRRPSRAQRVALIGNHLPRRCGIATFTTDLADALATHMDGKECLVVAMNEPGRQYDYPPRVAFEVGEGDVASYRRAADLLNVNGVDVVSLQHEYGIFGGRAGSLVLDFVRELRMPLVSTLHTVLAEPNPEQRAVMDELTASSERIVVMSEDGARLLGRVHGVPASKIDVIPHGIPSVPLTGGSKETLGLAGNDVILTFGLLSPDKGIEYVIDALPAILARRPHAIYVVVGVTHPHVREREGEAYRLMLEARAKELGVDSNIVFHDRFVSHEELVQFLSAADVYVTPYLNSEQITSGTLAYAVGAAKAVISTPYRYARELLSDGRGILVPPNDAAAIAREVISVFEDPVRRRGLEERAGQQGRSMTWPVVAASYARTFELAGQAHTQERRAAFRAKTLARRAVDLPEVDIAHLRALTDDTGILQHAVYGVPRRADGYCTDDNARALILTTMLEDVAVEPKRSLRALTSTYLAFVAHAFDGESERFRNFLSYAREWDPASPSDDSHGRAVWSLGVVAGRSSDRSTKGLARQLFKQALPAATRLSSPRAWAYAILGVDAYMRAFDLGPEVDGALDALVAKLVARLKATSTPEWPWFEDRLTYCNARLAQALIVGGLRTGEADVTALGLDALSWLNSAQTVDGAFQPIGSNGFWVRGEPRARFDQQPVDASATVSACLDAHRVTGDAGWLSSAHAAFQWFLGDNHLRKSLYDPVSGGCRDGIHEDRLNENQGAESTLSFLIALLEMHAAARVAASPSRVLRWTPAAAAERVSS